MNWKKLALLAVIGLALYFVIATPERASDGVGAALDWLASAAHALRRFVAGIFA